MNTPQKQKITPNLHITYAVIATVIASLVLAIVRIIILPAADKFNIQIFSTGNPCRAFNIVLAVLILSIYALRFVFHFAGDEAHKRHFHRDLPGKNGDQVYVPLHALRPPLPKPFLPGSIRLFNLLLGIMSAVCAVYSFVLASRATNVVFFYYILAICSALNAAYFLYITNVKQKCVPGMLYLALIPVIWNALRMLETFIRISTYASSGYHTSALLSTCAITLFFLYEARMFLPERRQWKPERHFIFACISILTIGSDVIPRIYSVLFLHYADQQLYFALYDLILLASIAQRLMVPVTRNNLNHEEKHRAE